MQPQTSEVSFPTDFLKYMKCSFFFSSECCTMKTKVLVVTKKIAVAVNCTNKITRPQLLEG